MIEKLKKLVPLVCCFFLLSGYTYGEDIKAGGEIPWPLSRQRVITVKNSKGLWELGNGQQKKLFNLEMRHDSRSGYDWIRVAQLDTKTFKVISWGETFFTAGPVKVPYSGGSSFQDISLYPLGSKKDKYGRYLDMFYNGLSTQHPYLLRMVEVKTNLGRVLGLSMINYVEKETEHFLGSRVLVEPLECVVGPKGIHLACDIFEN